MRADDTKTLLQSAFDAWSKGEGDFYRLVVDDVVWTIAGSSPMAGTYTSRQQFLGRAIHPIFQRLSEPIRPVVRNILVGGGHVVVVWEGEATALDGSPYDNTYCWVMRVQDGKVAEATAFFDAPPLTDLLERVQPAARQAS
jgi:uncharacterized protein